MVVLLRSLMLLGAIFLAAPCALAQSRLAFVAGIDGYEKIRPLVKAVNDSEAVAKSLASLGYKVTLAKDVGRLDFKAKWESFLRAVNANDIVVFFFAGHGMEMQGVNYLLPLDTPESAQGEDVLKVWSVNFRALQQQLAERKPQLTIFIIDACRNNPYKSRATGAIGVSVEKVEGAFILYSAGDNQEALDTLSEDDKDANSVFTRRLLPRLAQQGLGLGELAKQLADEVAQDALKRNVVNGKQVPHIQRPAFYAGLSGEFCFAGCNNQEAEKTKASQVSQMAEAWAVTLQTTSPAVLRAFIERSKGTIYADLAQARLDEIEKVRPTTGSQIALAPPPQQLAPQQLAAGKRAAFVVGNAQYAHSSPLQYPTQNARMIANRLASLGYSVTLILDADRRAFFRSWQTFLSKLSDGDTAVVYYGGHGVQVDGESYLVPIDAQIDDESAVRSEAISATDLFKSMGNKRLHTNVALFDTCRNNLLLTTTRGVKPPGLAHIAEYGVETFVMHSSSTGGCAEGDLFAKTVVKHIATPAQEIHRFGREVRLEVAAATRNLQIPSYYDQMTTKFCLAGPC
jgi:uncharacterized caspase-like protein